MEKMKGMIALFTIDKTLCVDCGQCVSACPMGVFHRKKDGSLAVSAAGCLDCYHCTAACPTGAISHDELGSETALPLPDNDSLLAKIQRRRSIRHFKPDAPDRAVIQGALDGAAYAPSAKNNRAYQWTVIHGQEAVSRVHRLVLDWAQTIPHLRHLVWLDRRGINPITCGAPCLVLVHCPDDCANPASDSVIAMTLAEQLLNEAGLGTCWGGYFHRAAAACPALKETLALPQGHTVHAVLMVGHPDEHYRRIPMRPAAAVNWIE